MKYAFVRDHSGEFGVRTTCQVLRIHFSGFYAWLTEPFSHRGQEYQRQTKLLTKAWKNNGNVHGYRKICDDLIDMVEAISENRIARLASLARVAA